MKEKYLMDPISYRQGFAEALYIMLVGVIWLMISVLIGIALYLFTPLVIALTIPLLLTGTGVVSTVLSLRDKFENLDPEDFLFPGETN